MCIRHYIDDLYAVECRQERCAHTRHDASVSIPHTVQVASHTHTHTFATGKPRQSRVKRTNARARARGLRQVKNCTFAARANRCVLHIVRVYVCVCAECARCAQIVKARTSGLKALHTRARNATDGPPRYNYPAQRPRKTPAQQLCYNHACIFGRGLRRPYLQGSVRLSKSRAGEGRKAPKSDGYMTWSCFFFFSVSICSMVAAQFRWTFSFAA